MIIEKKVQVTMWTNRKSQYYYTKETPVHEGKGKTNKKQE